jgi:hypothetical protein
MATKLISLKNGVLDYEYAGKHILLALDATVDYALAGAEMGLDRETCMGFCLALREKDRVIAELQEQLAKAQEPQASPAEKAAAKGWEAVVSTVSKHIPHWQSFGLYEDEAMVTALSHALRMSNVVSLMESWANEGSPPVLTSDGNGLWAVSFVTAVASLNQDLPERKALTVLVDGDMWKSTIVDAAEGAKAEVTSTGL